MKEEEIRPKELLDRYLELSAKDGATLDSKDFVEIDCPACHSKNSKTQFKKNNYTYKKCPQCNSLFCSPRPNQKQLDSLYFGSESSKFWSNVFFPSVADARREKLFRPKAQKIAQMIQQKQMNVSSICDVGAGYGLFLQEIKNALPNVKLYAIEPDSTSAEQCRKKNIETLVATAESSEEWSNKFDLVISSEVIEHVFDLKRFIDSISKVVKPGGYCLLTGLGYEGFDILTLQEKSKAVSPPHHLNFISLNGYSNLLIECGFHNIDAWTPGELDVDIVLNSDYNSEFIDVLKSRGPETIKAFQKFLSENKLSSHTWILAQRKIK